MTQFPTIRKPNKGEAVGALQRLLHLCVDSHFGPLTEEALKEWQTDHGLTPDGICGPKTWAKLLAKEATTKQSAKPVGSQTGETDVLLADVDMSAVRPATRRSITEIIVHCSATPDSKDYTVKDIKRWHLQRGFSDIGYHYVIYRDGKILSGRDVNTAGAHCTGHNTHSIGICYIGGMDAQNKQPSDTRTDAQRKSLVALIRRLLKLYPKAKVYGHCEFAAKACPSFEPSTLRTELRKLGCRC